MNATNGEHNLEQRAQEPAAPAEAQRQPTPEEIAHMREQAAAQEAQLRDSAKGKEVRIKAKDGEIVDAIGLTQLALGSDYVKELRMDHSDIYMDWNLGGRIKRDCPVNALNIAEMAIQTLGIDPRTLEIRLSKYLGRRFMNAIGFDRPYLCDMILDGTKLRMDYNTGDFKLWTNDVKRAALFVQGTSGIWDSYKRQQTAQAQAEAPRQANN